MAEPIELMKILLRNLDRQRRPLELLDLYHEGEQPLRLLQPSIEAELGDRIPQIVLNWPRMCTEAYEARLDIGGMRMPGQDESDGSGADSDLWQMMVENEIALLQTLGHIEGLALGKFYGIVGAADGDSSPVLTMESPLQTFAYRNPKTWRVESAVKAWRDEERVQWANLYQQGVRTTYRRKGRDWVKDDENKHNLDTCLVTEFVNRGRILRRDGVSEFQDVIPLANAANKMATDMMVSGEFHAMPRRWAVGVNEEDFVDELGAKLDAWSMVAGRIWSTSAKPGDVQYGQFPETDLAVFHNTIKVLAQLAAQLMYLPQDYMAFSSDNPTSAEGQRASETRMIKRAERIQTSFGAGWRNVGSDMLAAAGNTQGARDARRLEILWRSAATPTIAQVADASVKLVAEEIIDAEQAQEDIGYTPGQRQKMADRKAKRTAASLNASVRELFQLDDTGRETVNSGAAA